MTKNIYGIRPPFQGLICSSGTYSQGCASLTLGYTLGRPVGPLDNIHTSNIIPQSQAYLHANDETCHQCILCQGELTSLIYEKIKNSNHIKKAYKADITCSPGSGMFTCRSPGCDTNTWKTQH